MKKILLGLGVVTTLAAPVVLAISCGNGGEGTHQTKFEKDGVTLTVEDGKIVDITVDGTIITTMDDLQTKVQALAVEHELPMPENPLSLITVENNTSLQAIIDAQSDATEEGTSNEEQTITQFTQAEVDAILNQKSENPARVRATDEGMEGFFDGQVLVQSQLSLLGLEKLSELFTYTISNVVVTEGIDTAHHDTAAFTITATTKYQSPALSASDRFTGIPLSSNGDGAPVDQDQVLADNEQTHFTTSSRSEITATKTELQAVTSETTLTQALATKLGFGQFNSDCEYKISAITIDDAKNTATYTITVLRNGVAASTPTTFTDHLVTADQIGDAFNNLYMVTDGSNYSWTVHQTTDANKGEVSTELSSHTNGVGRVVSEIYNGDAIIYFALPTSLGIASDEVLTEARRRIAAAGGVPDEVEVYIHNTPNGWHYSDGVSDEQSANNTRIIISLKTPATGTFENGWWYADSVPRNVVARMAVIGEWGLKTSWFKTSLIPKLKGN